MKRLSVSHIIALSRTRTARRMSGEADEDKVIRTVAIYVAMDGKGML
jgi:hypothetical protein